MEQTILGHDATNSSAPRVNTGADGNEDDAITIVPVASSSGTDERKQTTSEGPVEVHHLGGDVDITIAPKFPPSTYSIMFLRCPPDRRMVLFEFLLLCVPPLALRYQKEYFGGVNLPFLVFFLQMVLMVLLVWGAVKGIEENIEVEVYSIV